MGIMAPQRRGIFGAHMRTDVPPTAGEPVMAQPQKAKVNWVGVLADALSGFAGGPANFANQQYQQRQTQDARQYAEQTYQRRRGDQLTDFRTQQQIEAEYRAPKVNDTVADFEWFKKLSPEDRTLYQNMRPEYRQGQDGQFYRINVAPPPQITEDDWNSAPVHGGPTPSASGGFRR